MAFAFFRRRQKMVIIIMAVLMVAFLVGMQGFNMLVGQGAGKKVVGTMRGDVKIDSGDVGQASMDLEVLQYSLELLFKDAAYRAVRMNGKDASWAYAILLEDARASGVSASAAELEAYLATVGNPVGSEEYNAVTDALKDRYMMPTKQFHALVARWLTIEKAFVASQVTAPPSVPQVQRLFRDLSERIELRVVRVGVEQFVDKQAEPTDQQIQQLFTEFQGRRAGTYSDEKAFGFGYYQPNRVAVSYLLISKDAIARTIRIDRPEARKHYREHKSKYVRKVPIGPAKEKSPKKQPDQDKKQPEEQEYKTEQMTLAEAMPLIMAQLTDTAAQRRMNDLVVALRSLASKGESAGDDVYRQVVGKLTLTAPAKRALETKIARVSISKERLDAAMDVLAASAGLQAICYPWGQPVSKGKILPADKKVSLRAKNITLAKALERIGRDLKVGEIQWAMCDGFGGVLFPVVIGGGNVSMFPVYAGATGLSNEVELRTHPVLGRSFTSPTGPGQNLVSAAFTAKGLQPDPSVTALVAVGQAGTEMYIRGRDGKVIGRLLWRLDKAVAAHKPQRRTEAMTRRIVRDFKIQQAFTIKAVDLAAEVEARARKTGLASAAKKAKLESKVTALFARKRRGYAPWGAPMGFVLSDVPWMELPRMSAGDRSRILAYIQDKVFALVPGDIEPPYPDKPRAIATVPVPALWAVFVIERIDYRPPVRSEYETRWRMVLMRELENDQTRKGYDVWFNYKNIVKRTGFKARGAPE